MTTNRITHNFNRAAADYDRTAFLQARVAKQLVAAATDVQLHPQSILDLGCGTGFVTEAAARQWPEAKLTALDASAAMLQEVRRKLPHVRTVQGDAATIDLAEKFDLIFSSMMLHWLPMPQESARRWTQWLKPTGRLHIALPVEGSFQEWRDLCHAEKTEDGIWRFPHESILKVNMPRAQFDAKNLTASFPAAHDFLRHLKHIGAATPKPEHKPMNAAVLRRILNTAPRPFDVTYRVLHIMMQPALSV